MIRHTSGSVSGMVPERVKLGRMPSLNMADVISMVYPTARGFFFFFKKGEEEMIGIPLLAS